MAFELARSLREATALTRAGRLREATAAIQTALTRRRETGPDAGRASDGRAVRQKPQQIDGLVPPMADAAAPRSPDARPTRPKMALGAVVAMLTHASRQGLAHQPRSLRVTPQLPEGSQFLTRSYAGPAGSRTYKLYLPRNRPASDAPLIVMLHGCKQDPDDFAAGTRMNALAEEHGFVVAYPQQPSTANPSSCWNWFDPRHQSRGSGEPAIIAGITNDILQEYGVDRRRVFVAGLSAGGAMAIVTAVSYPEIYTAVGVHSGLAYGSASDVVSAFATMRGDGGLGSPPRSARDARVNAIIFQGDADSTVHPSNAERIVRDFAGKPEGHITNGISGGRAYVQTIVSSGGKGRVEHWLVRGGGHAWSGGSAEGTFADVAGPDASREMVRFFIEGAPGEL